MPSCFSGCSALKGVKLNCPYNGTGDAFKDVFAGCTDLETGSIQVKTAHYDNYTASTALDEMKVHGNTVEEKKAKFSTF